MDFHIFRRQKKKKPPPKAPEPKPKQPSAAPKPPPKEAAAPPMGPKPAAVSPSGPRPCMHVGAYMDEQERMSRVPGLRNLEVTTSRTLKWNLKDPVDGRDYEYYYQDQGPAMPYLGGMQRPPAVPAPQHPKHAPPGQVLMPSSPQYWDYGCGGSRSAYAYPHGGVCSDGGYNLDEYPNDCVVM